MSYTFLQDLDDKFNVFILFLSLVLSLPEVQSLIPVDSQASNTLLAVQAVISLYLKLHQNKIANNNVQHNQEKLDNTDN